MTRLADIGLAELQVFDAVHRHRSVVDAGRALQIPQPTVSRWLAKLRDHFGDPLFVRTAHGMEPTEAAQALAGPIRDMLQIYRERVMQERTFDPATSRRNFRIAASDFGQFTLLPALDRWTARTAPLVRFTSVPLSRDTLPDGLEIGEIDLAFGGFPALSARMIEQTLYEDSYVCVVRAGHPLAMAGSLSIGDFCAARHVVISARDAGHVHQDAEERLLSVIPADHIRLISYNFSLAPMLIAGSDHILTAPRRVVELFRAQLALVTLPPPIALPLVQVKQYWHERAKHDPGHQWLRRSIAELVGAKGSTPTSGAGGDDRPAAR